MTVPLSWRLSVEGATDVKNRLNEINSSFEKGEISAREYAKEIRGVGRDARSFTNISRTQNQLFLAMHPRLNTLSRGMSTFASVSRTALSITNALNLAFLRGSAASSEELDIKARMAEVYRALNKETDPDKIQAYNEELAVLEARLKEIGSEKVIGGISDVITSIGGIGLAITALMPSVIRLLSRLKSIRTASTAIGSASAVGSLGSGAGAVAGAASGFATGSALAGGATGVGIGALVFPSIDEWLKSWNEGYAKWAEFRDNVMKPGLDKFFLQDIPNAIGHAGTFLSNFFTNDLPNWAKMGFEAVTVAFVTNWNNLVKFLEDGINFAIKGFESFVNMIISGFNRIIMAINRAFNSNIQLIPKITLDKVSLGQINTNEVKKPTSSVGVGTGIQNNITVMGSILTERELMNKIDQNTKTSYKSAGFTGF